VTVLKLIEAQFLQLLCTINYRIKNKNTFSASKLLVRYQEKHSPCETLVEVLV